MAELRGDGAADEAGEMYDNMIVRSKDRVESENVRQRLLGTCQEWSCDLLRRRAIVTKEIVDPGVAEA